VPFVCGRGMIPYIGRNPREQPAMGYSFLAATRPRPSSKSATSTASERRAVRENSSCLESCLGFRSGPLRPGATAIHNPPLPVEVLTQDPAAVPFEQVSMVNVGAPIVDAWSKRDGIVTSHSKDKVKFAAVAGAWWRKWPDETAKPSEFAKRI